MTARFSYRAPVLREELLDLLADHGETTKILAGGTDLLVNLRGGFATPSLVVNVKDVAGYAELSWLPGGELVIRPATTINDILEDPQVRQSYPLLVGCARDLASHQIRNRATVIGNVVERVPVRRHGAGAAVPQGACGDLVEVRVARRAVQRVLHGRQAHRACDPTRSSRRSSSRPRRPEPAASTASSSASRATTSGSSASPR